MGIDKHFRSIIVLLVVSPTPLLTSCSLNPLLNPINYIKPAIPTEPAVDATVQVADTATKQGMGVNYTSRKDTSSTDNKGTNQIIYQSVKSDSIANLEYQNSTNNSTNTVPITIYKERPLQGLITTLMILIIICILVFNTLLTIRVYKRL